ncbi:hypothetical protein [Niveibacterium sp.]|uniref:hypothetical protein n=1 Tax=Niveibacterium sp. TaxID=2017444 RepID=UPI0035B4D24E
MTRALISLLLAISLVSPASATYCDSDEDVTAVVAFISSDDEFRDYLCGDAACTKEEIGTRIDIRAETVNGKDVSVCLATPKQAGRNIYTAVLIRTPTAIYPEFVFFGSGIGPAKRTTNGYSDLVGTEIGDKGVATRTVFTWNGKHYIAKPINRH